MTLGRSLSPISAFPSTGGSYRFLALLNVCSRIQHAWIVREHGRRTRGSSANRFGRPALTPHWHSVTRLDDSFISYSVPAADGPAVPGSDDLVVSTRLSLCILIHSCITSVLAICALWFSIPPLPLSYRSGIVDISRGFVPSRWPVPGRCRYNIQSARQKRLRTQNGAFFSRERDMVCIANGVTVCALRTSTYR